MQQAAGGRQPAATPHEPAWQHRQLACMSRRIISCSGVASIMRPSRGPAVAEGLKALGCISSRLLNSSKLRSLNLLGPACRRDQIGYLR